MLKVAVLMGGYTGESVVSLKSGDLVLKNIPNKYEVYPVHVLSEGWYALEGDKKHPIEKGDFSFIHSSGEKINFDVVYNTIHGTPGEDGFMQAYFETIGQAYTGCRFYQAALTFNKKDCISVLNKYGIPSAKSVYISKDSTYNIEEIIKETGLPCFVKPNQSGSSLGISKVYSTEEMPKALEKAFAEDTEVLIESFLDGTEVSVGVLKYNGEVKVLGITEIVAHNDFFDYEAKYEGKSDEITPARISEQEKNKVEEIAIKAYKSLNMTGFSRSEYIIVDGIPHFLEINTLPGLSPASIFPQQAQHAGIALSDLFENEIQLALTLKK